MMTMTFEGAVRCCVEGG